MVCSGTCAAVLVSTEHHPRLDKDTSGVVLVALTAEVHARVQRASIAGRVRKQYLAVVRGTPAPHEGRLRCRSAAASRIDAVRRHPCRQQCHTTYDCCHRLLVIRSSGSASHRAHAPDSRAISPHRDGRLPGIASMEHQRRSLDASIARVARDIHNPETSELLEFEAALPPDLQQSPQIIT